MHGKKSDTKKCIQYNAAKGSNNASLGASERTTNTYHVHMILACMSSCSQNLLVAAVRCRQTQQTDSQAGFQCVKDFMHRCFEHFDCLCDSILHAHNR
jgi:hypothetical protein